MKTRENYIEEVSQYSANNYHPLPIILTRGEGIWVWDSEGKKYLDCLSAYSAINQGHRHPKIMAAVLEQAGQLTLTSRAFHNNQMGGFLKKLCEICEMEMALPMNTGAEAVETAIKTARKWGYKVKGVQEDKAEIIVCANNFHGRTTTIVGFSTEHQYRDGFGPFTPGFKIIDYGDFNQLEKAINKNTVAFLVEPIQGEAGILIPPEGFLTKAKQLCKKNNVLFILDEIQTGLGRTGRLFCFQHETDAKPDMLVLGKALGGGFYPVSAVVSSREVLGVFNPGDHGSTFGGNPLASAIAKASLDVIMNERLAENSDKMGRHLVDRLNSEMKSKHIREIRARGLFIGIDIKEASGPARKFCEALMVRGILAKETHQQVIRIAPPLIIKREDVDWMFDQLNAVLSA